MRISDRMTSKAPPLASSKPSSPVSADCTAYRRRGASAPCCRGRPDRRQSTESATSVLNLTSSAADNAGYEYLGCATLIALALDSGVRRRDQAGAAARARGKRAAVHPREGRANAPGPGPSRGIRPRNDSVGVRPAVGRSRRHRADARVQAVIARTYAAAHLGRHQRDGYDLCSTTHCQLYQPGRLKTSSWARLAVEPRATTVADPVVRKLPRPARSFTPTAADTPAPPPTSGGGRRAPLRASPTIAPPGTRTSPGVTRSVATSS